MAKKTTDETHNGHRLRLRKRYIRNGIGSLSDCEIMELFLAMSIPRVDVEPAAKSLLSKYGGLRGIFDAPLDDLLKIKGIGESSAASIKLVSDMITLCRSAKPETKPKISGNKASSIGKLMEYFRKKMSSKKKTFLELVCFDADLRVIPGACATFFEGGANYVDMDPRKILDIALKNGASSIAVAHNHPRGGPKPSPEDVRFTKKLSDACKPVNLNFIEHVVVGKDACFSFRRDGRFDDLYDESAG